MRAPTREKGFAICVRNHGAEDLDVRKIYRILSDKPAAAEGYLRVIDESGDDYLYPADYFVFLKLPQKAQTVLGPIQQRARRRGSSNIALQRCSPRPLSASVAGQAHAR